MALHFTTAQTELELQQILDLQYRNLPAQLSQTEQSNQGFVTVRHNLQLLKQMNEAVPQIIAKDGDTLAGYALVMPQAFRSLIPVLEPMFAQLDQLSYEGVPFVNIPYYVMGQICVAEAYRGQGVFDGLYHQHKIELASRFRLCVTEVAKRNTRSMRAHERVGFEVIYSYQDATDDWNVVVLNLHRQA